MLVTCSHCAGFVPANVSTCPHCGADSLDVKTNSKLGTLVKGFTAAATSGVVAVTLMACYGAPFIDEDRDGFDGNYDDCNDRDPAVHPDAPDTLGDGIDQNCDGVDGVAPDAGSEGSSSSGGSSGSSSGGSCVSCNQAVNSTGLVAPPALFCTVAGQTAFDALKTCVCSTNCSVECGANVCQGSTATTICSECVQTNCSTQNLDCSEN